MHIELAHLSCPFTIWVPADGRLFERFAYDTETTDLDEGRPYLTPSYVVGAACDARRGVFISRADVLPFFEAHRGVPFICHNAAFDLRVTDALLRPGLDVYAAVEADHVWDTLILKRLLSLATAGHTAQGECGLADCARAHLGVTLQKGQTDAQGRQVRTGFGRFLGQPPSAIPAEYLTYLAQDALATWHLFWELNRLITEVLRNSYGVWGYVNEAPDRVWGGFSDSWLRDVIRRFGPLTHHVQLRASILMDVLTANGIGVDQARREEKAAKVQAVLEACKGRLRQRGYLIGEKGSSKAMQSILSEFKRANPDVELKTTPTGKWSTAEEDLAELAARDRFFADYATYKAAEKLLSTYLGKMGRRRLHPKFGYLLQTGRTNCCGFTLQNLPNEKELLDQDPEAATIRGCFVPGEGNVFIDSDFSQIELVVLGYAIQKQFGLRSVLAELVNSGQDVHRLIAATMLNKAPADVTDKERKSVKPVSFGRPGGMGPRGLRQVAKAGYRLDLTEEEVQERIAAYHRLCPELTEFLRDEVDAGEVVAAELGLTPARYYQAIGAYHDPHDPEGAIPAGWTGGMLLKVLRDETPLTKRGAGRAYTAEEVAFFWDEAQRLPAPLKPEVRARLLARRPDSLLWEAVRNWAGRRPVFTVTGRLRANTTFCSSRNTVFQGAAADGAILALWNVWRAGYKVVDFVHDQLVVECPADDKVKDRVADVERLMKEGMALVVPGMLVKVETVVTASLNKTDLDPRYDSATKVLIDGAVRATA
jgi:DNA polymerase I